MKFFVTKWAVIFLTIFLVISFSIKAQNGKIPKELTKEQIDSIAAIKNDDKTLLWRVLTNLLPKKEIPRPKINTDFDELSATADNQQKLDNATNLKLKYSAPSNDRVNLLNRLNAIGYKTEKEWAELYKINYNKDSDTTTYNLTHEIIGFYPFWLGDVYKNYNYSLYSRIAYVGYFVDAQTGNSKTTHNWESTEFFDYAYRQGTKVDLNVTLHGSEKHQLFFNNPTAQSQLAFNLIKLLEDKNADGFNLDFGKVDTIHKNALANFVIDLSVKLHGINPEHKLSINLPQIDWEGAYQVAKLEKFVDYFIYVATESHGADSKVAGPQDPLIDGELWKSIDVDFGLNHYFEQGIPKAKTILALSFSGKVWQTVDSKIGSESLLFKDWISVAEIAEKEKNWQKSFDPVSFNAFYTYSEDGKSYQVWFNDLNSLTYKFDYIVQSKIGGLGIWALGEENGNLDYGNLIKTKFTQQGFGKQKPRLNYDSLMAQVNLIKLSEEAKLKGKTGRISTQFYKEDFKPALDRFSGLIILGLFILLLFALTGLIIALFDENVKEVLFSMESAIYIFAISVLVFILLILRMVNIVIHDDLEFIVGLIAGTVISIIFMTIAKKVKKGEETP